MEREQDSGTRREIDELRGKLQQAAPSVAAAIASLSTRHPTLREDLLLHRTVGRLIDRCQPAHRLILASFPSNFAPTPQALENARFYFFNSRGGLFPASALLKEDYQMLNGRGRSGEAERAAAQFYLGLCAFLWDRFVKNPMVKPTAPPKERRLQCLPGGRK